MHKAFQIEAEFKVMALPSQSLALNTFGVSCLEGLAFGNQSFHHIMKTYSFEKLEVWQEARQLSVKIYKITRDFPDEEKFGLISQLRRSSISISSNIAEATSRHTSVDQARFYEIAYGSLMELLNQLIVSSDLYYLNHEILLSLRMDIDKISFKLTALRNSILKS